MWVHDPLAYLGVDHAGTLAFVDQAAGQVMRFAKGDKLAFVNAEQVRFRKGNVFVS